MKAWLASIAQRRNPAPRSLQYAAFVICCALAALTPALPAMRAEAPQSSGFPGWPKEFDGAQLSEQPLTAREMRFWAGFPGKVARFTDGKRQIILRWAGGRSDRFHLAARCYRAMGYHITQLPAALDANGNRWCVYRADGRHTSLRVRERILDNAGNAWTDEAAYRWDAFWRRTSAPWWGITIVEPI